MSKATNICKKIDCIYRAAANNVGSCDFRTISGVGRGCPVDGCFRYKSGKRRTRAPVKDLVLNVPVQHTPGFIPHNIFEAAQKVRMPQLAKGK
jgi:hypothetical protein